MGEYQKTYDAIKRYKDDIKKRREDIAKLQKQIDEIEDEIYWIELSIKECEGYLLELDWIDNHNDDDWRANK